MAKFKVRARTVDMLGRQQIAGIPTAISELFKNAHDAYAKNVEIDYFRDDGLFVLRDDGLGMTRDDFEQRWLTLGTDSKLGKKGGLVVPAIDENQPRRPILGEKGIGRLAIASIGAQVLVISRAKRDDILFDSVVAYINWGFFELPGLDLNEIEIPVRYLKGGILPDSNYVNEMLDEIRIYYDMLTHRVDKKVLDPIINNLNQFSEVNPQEYQEFLGKPNLSGHGHGTHFYILPANRLIEEDIDGIGDPYKAAPMEKMLLGFTNTVTFEHKRPPIVASFRDHIDTGDPIERVGRRAFFTPEEFKASDHHFQGQFDGYGNFQGTVSIYHQEPQNYVLACS